MSTNPSTSNTEEWGIVAQQSAVNTSNTTNTFSAEVPRQTTVSINSEKMSVTILLLCLFLPFLSPIIALFRGKFMLLLLILILWAVSALLLFIPVIGWLAVFIFDIVIAVQVAKSHKTTEVVVNH